MISVMPFSRYTFCNEKMLYSYIFYNEKVRMNKKAAAARLYISQAAAAFCGDY